MKLGFTVGVLSSVLLCSLAASATTQYYAPNTRCVKGISSGVVFGYGVRGFTNVSSSAGTAICTSDVQVATTDITRGRFQADIADGAYSRWGTTGCYLYSAGGYLFSWQSASTCSGLDANTTLCTCNFQSQLMTTGTAYRIVMGLAMPATSYEVLSFKYVY